MIRSAHVLGSPLMGGADHFYVRLVEALHRAGHPTLAITRKNSPVAATLDPQVPQVRLPMANKWDFYSLLRIRQSLTDFRPDIVQTYMGRATRLTRVPKKLDCHHVARLGGYYKVRGYYRHADAWVGNTPDICRYLREEGLPSNKVFEVGNFVRSPEPVQGEQLQQLRAQLGIPDNALIVFSLGRMVKTKGFQDLIAAISDLPDTLNGSPVHLILAGDGSFRSVLTEQGKISGRQSNLHFVGWQDSPGAYYQLADVMVCPSRHETLGNVILEAWSHGCPVITTNHDGAQHLVQHGKNALVVPLEDPEVLAHQIQAFFQLPEADRRALADAGLSAVAENYSETRIVNQYLDLYRSLQE